MLSSQQTTKQELTNSQPNSAVLGISIGQPYHTGEALTKMIERCSYPNTDHKFFYILNSTALQIHKHLAKPNGTKFIFLNKDEATQQANAEGKKWIEDNKKLLTDLEGDGFVVNNGKTKIKAIILDWERDIKGHPAFNILHQHLTDVYHDRVAVIQKQPISPQDIEGQAIKAMSGVIENRNKKDLEDLARLLPANDAEKEKKVANIVKRNIAFFSEELAAFATLAIHGHTLAGYPNTNNMFLKTFKCINIVSTYLLSNQTIQKKMLEECGIMVKPATIVHFDTNKPSRLRGHSVSDSKATATNSNSNKATATLLANSYKVLPPNNNRSGSPEPTVRLRSAPPSPATLSYGKHKRPHSEPTSPDRRVSPSDLDKSIELFRSEAKRAQDEAKRAQDETKKAQDAVVKAQAEADRIRLQAALDAERIRSDAERIKSKTLENLLDRTLASLASLTFANAKLPLNNVAATDSKETAAKDSQPPSNPAAELGLFGTRTPSSASAAASTAASNVVNISGSDDNGSKKHSR